jgi:hypothetical protein
MIEWSIWVCIGNLRALECRLEDGAGMGKMTPLWKPLNFILEVLYKAQ